MPTKEEDQLVEQYLKFCANPLRGEEQVLKEYELLKHHPRITSLAFYRPDILMVGTDQIMVYSKQQLRVIGEMIIFFIRRQVDEYWETDFRFVNVTNPLMSKATDKQPSQVTHMHPHIIVGDHDLIECPNGRLCISKGQFGVYAAMRKGEMHVAAPRMVEILEVYPSGSTYADAEKWPELEFGGGKSDA